MPDMIYASALSPFAARLRIAVALKGLSPRFELPPGGSGSADLKKITPFGRIPVLLHEDAVLVESLALLDYLEDAHPESRQLRPADAVNRARVRMIQLLFDHNVLPVMKGVFAQLTAGTPDTAAAHKAFDDVATELGKLVTFFDDGGPVVGDEWSTADCAMAPFAHLMNALAPRFDAVSPIDRLPRLRGWWHAFSQVPEVDAVLTQLRSALAAAVPVKKT